MLGFSLWRKTTSLHLEIHVGFAFPADNVDDDIYFFSYFWDMKGNISHKKPDFWEPIERFCDKEKRLDRGRLLKRAVARLRQWGVAW
jgi:hypothetical protein